MKSILQDLEVLKLPFFAILGALIFVDLINIRPPNAGVGNDWLLLVIHTVILRILSHFLKNFEGKSFCKKPW